MPRETAAVSAQSVSTLQPCTMSRHFMHGTGASGDALWTGCDELWSPCNERSHSARKTPMVLQTAGTISNHYTDLYNAKAMKTRDAHSPKSASWKATNWLTLTCPAPVRILWNPIFCKSSWVWPGSLFCTGLEHALGLAALLENTTARHFKLFLTHHRKVTEIMKSVWCELKTSSFWGSITPSISVTPCQEASPFHLSCYWTWPPPHLSQYWWTTWHDTPLLPQPPSHHVNEKHTISENITTICHHVGEQHDCHISEHHVSSISLTILVNSWLLHISDRLFHISVTTTTPISFHIHHHVYKKKKVTSTSHLSPCQWATLTLPVLLHTEMHGCEQCLKVYLGILVVSPDCWVPESLLVVACLTPLVCRTWSHFQIDCKNKPSLWNKEDCKELSIPN